jgi:hypothetical protein
VTWTNNPDSLAWGILEVLKNPSYAQWLIDNAYEDLERRFSWAKIAQQTKPFMVESCMSDRKWLGFNLSNVCSRSIPVPRWH